MGGLHYTAIRWLVHWPSMGGLLHLVHRGGAWAAWALHSPLLAVPNVTAHPSTASVPTSHHLMWHYNRVNALRNRFLCVSTLWMEHCRHITASVPVATDNVNKQQFDPTACNNTADKTDPQAVNLYTINLLLLLVCVSLTTIGQPRNSVFIRRV